MTWIDRHLLSAVIQSNIFHITHIAFCSAKTITILHIFDLKKERVKSQHYFYTFLLPTLQTEGLLLETATKNKYCPSFNTTAVCFFVDAIT